MKKVTFLISFLLFLIVSSYISAYSQSSFEITSCDSIISTQNVNNEIESQFDIRNLSNSNVTVYPSIIVDQLAEGHEVSVCTYFCYPYVTRTTSYKEGSDEIDLPASFKISQVLGYQPTAHLKPNMNTGQSKIRIRFTNVADENDYIDVPYTFNVGITSISEIKPTDFVVAYPNPTNNILSVYSEILNIEKIEIYDIHGKLVTNEKSSFNYKALDLSSLAKGNYMMIVYLEDKSMKRLSVVIE
ncbi:MAG: T9SS type A sorting domain-containing protein [Ignavibacteria bacterium]|nr:T9SS type A sorting domain-containing protein [Ignavibacteria bacterium]